MLFFVLNVKNDRLDATLIIILAEYTGVILTLTSGKHDFMIVILTLFLKYYDVNYLVIYLRRINWSNVQIRLVFKKTKTWI